MHDITGPVTEKLHFDVTRLLDVALGVDAAVAKVALRLGRRGLQALGEPGGVAYDAHALAATAGGGLDQQRKADRSSPAFDLGEVAPGDAGGDRHAVLRGEGAGADLVPHQANRVGVRTDEGEARGADARGEVRVLRQKAIAGMDRVRTGAPRAL